MMDIKQGWKTSEFWVVIGTIAAQLFGLPVDPMVNLVAGLYAAARSGLKIWGSGVEEYEIEVIEEEEE
jgi:hypothetical protein